jgi:uncharacterized membrane protein YuzA (DUF378 family)
MRFAAKKTKKNIRRTIYGVVGIVGVGTAAWAGFNWATFTDMGIWGITSFSLLTIGGINWGVVSLTGNKDLFQLIGL